jgi:hypothetical protein
MQVLKGVEGLPLPRHAGRLISAAYWRQPGGVALPQPTPRSLRVGSGVPAQACGLPRQWLIKLAVAEALHDARDMGQEIGPAHGEVA